MQTCQSLIGVGFDLGVRIQLSNQYLNSIVSIVLEENYRVLKMGCVVTKILRTAPLA